MKTLEPAALSIPKTYLQLREAVRQALFEGQRKIEHEKVRTYWRSGKHINEHILCNDRAGYDKKVIEQLGGDLDTDPTVLWRCLKFARAFPILAARQELTWAHYRTLITVENKEKRLELEKQAIEKNWSTRNLEIKVRDLRWRNRLKDPDAEISKLALPKLGPFYTFRIIRPEAIHSNAAVPLLDLGFSNTFEMNVFPRSHFKADTIISSIKKKNGTYSLSAAPSALTADDLYTYKAYVENVVDGDTIKVEFQLGFGLRHRDVIRLKSIDAPEMDTPEGKAAKMFVERELKGVGFLTIKSFKTEKWRRYLGDVFYEKPGTGKLIYLNQLLLDEGHALRVRDG